jgi:hypothetical protein
MSCQLGSRVHAGEFVTRGQAHVGPGYGGGGGFTHDGDDARGGAPVQCVAAATSAGTALFRQQRSGSAAPPSGVQYVQVQHRGSAAHNAAHSAAAAAQWLGDMD